jgi:Flp pilus assembly protein TadD
MKKIHFASKFAIAISMLIAVSGCNKNDAKSIQEGAAEVRAAIVAGNYGDAANLARKAATNWPKDPSIHYELARAEALAGNRGKALDAIEMAIKSGLPDASHALDDAAFDAIRDDARFAALVNRASPTASGTALVAGNGANRVEIRENAGGTHIQAGNVKLDTDF